MQAANPDRIAKGLYWDRAWSLVSGCSYVSEGCANCWAAREAHMRAQQRNVFIRARYAGLTTEEGRWNGQIRLLEQNLDLPLRVKKPTVWAAWNDLFHEDVPYTFIFDLIKIIRDTPQHTYQILTKRPEKMEDFFLKLGFVLPNLWLGVTTENQEQADKRIPVLLQIPAAVRFVSVEPILGRVDLTELPIPHEIDKRGFDFNALTDQDDEHYYNDHPKIDWVICGGESGPSARPMHPDWVRSLRDQCQAAGTPFFFKQWGEWAEIEHRFAELPDDIGLSFSGEVTGYASLHNAGAVSMRRVGKKAAGRLLDGKTWDEYPEVAT